MIFLRKVHTMYRYTEVHSSVHLQEKRKNQNFGVNLQTICKKKLIGVLWGHRATIFLKPMKRSDMVKSSKKKSKNVDGNDLCDPKSIKIKKNEISWNFIRGFSDMCMEDKILCYRFGFMLIISVSTCCHYSLFYRFKILQFF